VLTILKQMGAEVRMVNKYTGHRLFKHTVVWRFRSYAADRASYYYRGYVGDRQAAVAMPAAATSAECALIDQHIRVFSMGQTSTVKNGFVPAGNTGGLAAQTFP
jgi:hypothetical protein